ncbi:nucleotidyltransferase and HEPN domain-containing protein [Pararhizobium sp. LjRoot255]|uniref:nucleotidyltransferase and HEPN domain-containing protein n=1 Tax=Pararhizobium sp. LjRoot255 TaxID=3342298 RepID=UPI003ECF12AE
MKTSLDHLPPVKQHELRRVVEIILEEFEDALKGASAEFKKRGRILKIILFGSYARGTFVDEPHTKKGYRSDFDILVIVNNRKLADFSTYWHKTAERLLRTPEISTPTSLIIHSLRDVNAELRRGRYFFVDIRRDGLALYELDDEPLAVPGQVSADVAWQMASGYFEDRLPGAMSFLDTAKYLAQKGQYRHASFELHQSIEQAYSTLLLVLTSYSPPSHNIRFLRGLVEEQARDLVDIWPRNQQRYVAWFNVLNEAYVKARYSPHFEISEETLRWLSERTELLIQAVEKICRSHLDRIRPDGGEPR